MSAAQNPELLLDEALNALSTVPHWRSVLDALPAPIYTTDAEGKITYFNQAAVELAGQRGDFLDRRREILGALRLLPSVTWQIYTTTGERMPHDECPMAEAVRRREPIRDKVAIVESRPLSARKRWVVTSIVEKAKEI